jgi:hypothetical protein
MLPKLWATDYMLLCVGSVYLHTYVCLMTLIRGHLYCTKRLWAVFPKGVIYKYVHSILAFALRMCLIMLVWF